MSADDWNADNSGWNDNGNGENAASTDNWGDNWDAPAAGGEAADGSKFASLFPGGGGDDVNIGYQGGGSFTCRNCNQEGHKAAECPEPKKLTGECFNCGQVGHNKADCTNPRVERPFTGTCRACGAEGHKAAACPGKKPLECLVHGADHVSTECKAPHLEIFPEGLPDMAVAVAWENLLKADKEKHLDDFMEAFFCYAKGQYLADAPIDLADMETGFRAQNLNAYLIAAKFESEPNKTNVNMAGVPDQEFCLTVRWNPKPVRQFEAQYWPESPEENLERLKSCGFEVERRIIICGNCNEIGHIMKRCPEIRHPSQLPEIICVNCNEVGHRCRDCPKARVVRSQRTCRNCDKPGHKASECEEPINMDKIECKSCNQMGHFARDCPEKADRPPMACHKCNEEGHMAKECPNAPAMTCRNCNQEGHMARECPNPRDSSTMKCRNCDEMGHGSRECPKPTDWSRVQCKNCGEFGHTIRRCKVPVKEDGASGDGWGGTDANAGASNNADMWGDGGGGSAGGWDNDNNGTAAEGTPANNDGWSNTDDASGW